MGNDDDTSNLLTVELPIMWGRYEEKKKKKARQSCIGNLVSL